MDNDGYHGNTWTEYFHWRWKISNYRKFYSGEGLEVDEADSVINALALINALVLTIPFGLVTSLDMDYFDNVQALIETCDTGVDWNDIQLNMIAPLYVSVVCSTLALVISTLYYFLRSKQYFYHWWKSRGKWSVVATTMFTIIAVLTTLTLFATLMGWYIYNHFFVFKFVLITIHFSHKLSLCLLMKVCHCIEPVLYHSTN